MLSACKKDLSSLDDNKIAGFTVDNQSTTLLNVFQFESLKLNPIIKSDIKEENLSYTWKLNIVPFDTVFRVLANTKNLDIEITNVPNGAGRYYTLIYEVLDKSNGLKYINSWYLNVRNGLGEGLVIADSRDGQNSDLNLLMAPLVTANYDLENIRYNIYSGVNGAKISGIVKQLQFYTESSALFGITNNSVFKIKPLDYSVIGFNGDLFTLHTGDYAPQKMGVLNQGFYYIEKGKLSANYLATNYKFSIPFDEPAFEVPSIVSVNGKSGIPSYLSFYDEKLGAFAYQSSIQSFGDKKFHALPSNPTAVFNAGSLPNKTNLAAGVGQNEDFMHLLKDKSTGAVSLYALTKPYFNTSNVLIPSDAKAVYDLNQSPGIAQAKDYVVFDDQRVLFYATQNKIYATLYGGSTAAATYERFVVPAGEEITTLQMYQESDYPFGKKGYKTTNNRQLILSTYNGTEGKVYILPLINLEYGNIDIPNLKVYGGFGKISAITPQK